MKKLLFISLLTLILMPVRGQGAYGDEPLAHTYSIIAYDAEADEMGIAIQSHWFSVGPLCVWGESGVGMVVTQSFVNPAFGPDGLALMKEGMSPQEVLDKLVGADDGREVRQVSFMTNKGELAAHTGKNCIEAAGHVVGDHYSCHANLMLNEDVWPAMAKAFEETEGRLAHRLISALEAGEAAGGDIRGKQSAAILVMKCQSSGKPWEDHVVDLRVEDHATPIKEIRRLLDVHRAYEHMNEGDVAVEEGDMKKAMEEYGAAQEMFPENLEMQYWNAIALLNNGYTNEALPIMKSIFEKDRNWQILLPRLVKPGLLKVDEQTMMALMRM